MHTSPERTCTDIRWARQACATAILSLGLLAVAPAAYAQEAVLEGQVIDQQDSALVGVTVELNAPALPGPVVITTDQRGEYRFASLSPGVYTLTFTLSGFQSAQHEVTLGAGERRAVGVELGLAAFAQQVDVVAVSPLLGAPVNREIVAATVSVLASDELGTRGAASLSSGLNERLGAVSLEDTTTNIFQPTLRFRGFMASPLLGLPQGIAVYQNGVRINEPFGDTVQFDLVPLFALDLLQLSAGAEPTFGLNALGGALALQLKNGFDNRGFRGELSGGSFGRFTGTAELGATRGPWAVYLGATRFRRVWLAPRLRFCGHAGGGRPRLSQRPYGRRSDRHVRRHESERSRPGAGRAACGRPGGGVHLPRHHGEPARAHTGPSQRRRIADVVRPAHRLLP